MHPFSHWLTSEAISCLAGGAVYDRGVELWREGAVKPMAVTDTAIEATVSGTRDYQIRFWLDGEALAYECTCPFFKAGHAFCKHLVAAGLKWLDREEPDANAEPRLDQPRRWRYTTTEAALLCNTLEERLQHVRALIDQVTGIASGKEQETSFLLSKPTTAALDSLTDMLFQGEFETVFRECGYFIRAVNQAKVNYYGTNPSSYLVQRLFALHFAAAQHVPVRKEELLALLAEWKAGWPVNLAGLYAPLFETTEERLQEKLRLRQVRRIGWSSEHMPGRWKPPEAPAAAPPLVSTFRLGFSRDSGPQLDQLVISCGELQLARSFTSGKSLRRHLAEWLQVLMLAPVMRSDIEIGQQRYERLRLRAERQENGLVRLLAEDFGDEPSWESALDVVMPFARLVAGIYQGLQENAGFHSGKMQAWLEKHPFVPAIIEFKIQPIEMETTGETSEFRQEIWVNHFLLLNRRSGNPEDGADVIDWRALVASVEKDGLYQIAECVCLCCSYRNEAPCEITHVGDLTRLRIAWSDHVPAPCDYVFLRKHYAEAVLAALGSAIAMHQAHPARTTSDFSGLTEAELQECQRRIAAFCASMPAASSITGSKAENQNGPD